MSSRKQLIIKKYDQLLKEVKPLVETELFPTLEDIDVVDLLLLIEYLFPEGEDVGDKLKDLFKLKNIKLPKLDTMIKLVDIVKSYLVWIKSLN